jgi:excisionase family DNA binding protein
MKMDSNSDDSNDPDRSNAGERDFLSTAEAADKLGVSYYTVYEYIREKRLVAEMVGGVYLIPKKAVAEFKAKPTGRTRANPPPWRVYRAGAQVRGLDIRVQVRPDQRARLLERFKNIQEAQQHLFRGTMQRYVFEDEDNPAQVIISLVWKDTELPDERILQEALVTFQNELADLLDWSTAQYTRKRAIIHT